MTYQSGDENRMFVVRDMGKQQDVLEKRHQPKKLSKSLIKGSETQG